ncbi:MAG TPA: PQQ-binding-like beta-propeller repeat protein [Polyangiaceae bacterium]
MRLSTPGALAGLAGLAGAASVMSASLGTANVATAQTIDVERPITMVVGTPSAGVRTDRVDGARSGRSRVALPAATAGGLRTGWSANVGAAVDVAPVVDGRGTTYAIGARGEVVAFTRDGTEAWRASTGAIPAGPPALLADDTLVFADAAGEAIALRDGALRWRVHFGRSDPTRALPPAPLPLDDGGIVVATTRDLAVLGADGREHARTTLPETIASPLLSALGKVVAVTATGAVWTWTPGAPEPTRVAGFGSPVEDGAALADDHTVLAVTSDHTHLTTVDLLRGTSTTRTIAPAGGLLVGPPAMRGGNAFVFLQAPTGDLAVAFDPSGNESLRALLSTHPLAVAPDGGPVTPAAAPHTPPLVDGAGTLAFAGLDGAVGVLTGGVVDAVANVCPQTRAAAPPVTALVPLGPGAILVACRSGLLVAMHGVARAG